MTWNEEQIRLLTQVLPDVAARLRMPLGNLHLACERLLSESGAAEDSTEAAIFRQSYYRLLRTVNNLSYAPHLLDTEMLRTENTDLVEWLGDLCRQAEPLAYEAGVALVFHCDERYHIAAIDREGMERLVWNLLGNALKFTDGGGRITVTLESMRDTVMLTVSDTGCGIAEERIPFLFERWLQADKTDALPYGFGLGLPICRRIAQGHGGRLLLQSREGEGTRVSVALPDKRWPEGRVQDTRFDYAGGFQRSLLELSDALPYKAYMQKNIDL